MSCLKSHWLIRCSPSSTSGTGVLCPQARPSWSCAKCDMKYESCCRSERAINIPSKHMSPCALTNMLLHTHGHNWITEYAHSRMSSHTHVETPAPQKHAAMRDTPAVPCWSFCNLIYYQWQRFLKLLWFGLFYFLNQEKEKAWNRQTDWSCSLSIFFNKLWCWKWRGVRFSN